MPGRWDYRLSCPSPRCALSPWLAPASPPPSNNTGNSANSFRQYPASGLLPQIQGEQGGAEGQTEVGAGGCVHPTGALLYLPAPSVSGSNLRFPPALKIALAARLPSSPGNELPDWEFCQVSRGI